jgi:geranylgeranyl diphosphate synthase, type I
MTELAGADLLGAILREHLASGGKRLRARLALAACEALGVAPCVPWAAACEMVHNATLVHDDLQDGDRARRGQPTVWVRYGAAQAINAGDLAFMLPFLAVGATPVAPAIRAQLAQVLATCTARVIRGQAEEQALPGRGALGWDEYANAATGKTSALFALPVQGAALLAGRTPATAEQLASPFNELGLLFQMQDDVLDLYGEKGRGRAGSDLYEGKVSCLVVEHVALHPDDREGLTAFLQRERQSKSEAEVNAYVDRLQQGGALAAALGRIEAMAQRLASAEGGALTDVITELVRVTREPIAHLSAPPRG